MHQQVKKSNQKHDNVLSSSNMVIYNSIKQRIFNKLCGNKFNIFLLLFYRSQKNCNFAFEQPEIPNNGIRRFNYIRKAITRFNSWLSETTTLLRYSQE